MAQHFSTVDEYIKTFPEDIQKILEELRQTIREELPDEAEEVISYNIPTFKLHGNYVIYFSAWKDHISLYPIPRADKALQEEMTPYMSGKGTLKFPLGKPISQSLVKKITKGLIESNRERTGY
jgi:uncharacterized protein YdhG (YjbR/CyaY superfamily)